MRPRALASALLLVGVVCLLVPSARLRAAATPGCRPLRAVFYAQSDWIRLADGLAANASPCAEYYISIPPLAADKTQFRTGQAEQIRALGPSFHALAEVHVGGWRRWVTDNNETWYDAGVEARRRMAATGFDVTLGDGWIVNELSSAVRRGIGSARTEMRDLVHGLYDGDGGPAAKGGVFDIGIDQPGSGPGAQDLPTYKSQLEDWLQDATFWADMSSYVSDWSQELYGDVRNYAVAGEPLAARRAYLDDYLQHQLVHVRLGGAATAGARTFLESADSPLANAAWQWDVGFGWTLVTLQQMEDFVSAQVYALRHFSALDGQAADHWGFAWAPHNAPADQTAALIDRLAAAIHDSGEPLDANDPGIGACGPPGQNLWCAADLTGASPNDAWRTFTYWGRLALAFTTPPRALVAGHVSAPIAIQTRLRGNAYATPNAFEVTLASSSPQGRFSTGTGGPWTSTLDLAIPAGAGTAPGFYYTDTVPGRPVLTASALGVDGGTQAETVVQVAPPPPPPPTPPPPPAPPQPPPPPPPPALNRQPRIASARFGEVSRLSRGRRLTTESIRARVCDDSEGRVLARVEQSLRQGKHVRARGVLTRSLAPTAGACRTYRIRWRVRTALLARGTYTARLRVRDSEGAWSKPAVKRRRR